jgi:hypothetical protein
MTREESLAFLDQILDNIENADSKEVEKMQESYKKVSDSTIGQMDDINIYMAHELSCDDLLCESEISWNNLLIDSDFNEKDIEFSYNKKGLFESNEWKEYEFVKKVDKIAA